MVWLPVAAPEDPERRLRDGTPPVTADELREVAASYDTDYREAFLICAYDPDTGRSGSAHFEARVRPPLSPIAAYRFNEGSQELEAEVEVTNRLRRVFSAGWRTPSIGLFRFRDHPSGEAKWYGQHVTLAGPGEVEVIAGLGGERWAERFRTFEKNLSTLGDAVQHHRFRTLTTEELPMSKPKEEPGKAEKAAPETKKEPEERKRAAEPKGEGKLEAKTLEDKPAETKLRAVKDDPVAELRQQVTDLAASQADLTAKLRTFIDAAGDPAKVKAAAADVEKLRTEMRERAAADHKAHITREVEALATGSEPRLRTADVDFTTRALLAFEPADAEAELVKLRAKEPIAEGLDEPFDTGLDLPDDFELDIERWRTNGGNLPSGVQLRDYARLAAAGKGNPLAAAKAEERKRNLKGAYDGRR